MSEELFRYFSERDLAYSGCFSVPMAIEVAEQAMLDYHSGKILCPGKVIQIFDEETQNRINCLPATLLTPGICGMKWVSVFPFNPMRYGISNVSALILLSEIRSGRPVALLEATLCSNLRTGAITAVAAKFLANVGSRRIAFIGSGEQARAHFLCLKHVLPALELCFIASRTRESCERFVESMSPLFPDVEFRACGNRFQEAVVGADVIVTATSAQEPILQADWVKPGALYCHVGGWEDSYEVPLKASKIFCDSWHSAKIRAQTISRLHRMGRLRDEAISGDLHQVVAGEIEGRANGEEFIYFNAVGLAYVDVALGWRMAQMARQAGLGAELVHGGSGILDQSVRDFIKL